MFVLNVHKKCTVINLKNKSEILMNSNTNGRQQKNSKVPKGYRLKISTHNKIKELQGMIKGSQDTVISRAIKLYMKQIKQHVIA